MKTWTAEKTEEALTLWRQGWSLTAIGKHLGLSRGAVVGRLNRLGYLKHRQNKKIEISLPKLSI